MSRDLPIIHRGKRLNHLRTLKIYMGRIDETNCPAIESIAYGACEGGVKISLHLEEENGASRLAQCRVSSGCGSRRKKADVKMNRVKFQSIMNYRCQWRVSRNGQTTEYGITQESICLVLASRRDSL